MKLKLLVTLLTAAGLAGAAHAEITGGVVKIGVLNGVSRHQKYMPVVRESEQLAAEQWTGLEVEWRLDGPRRGLAKSLASRLCIELSPVEARQVDGRLRIDD